MLSLRVTHALHGQLVGDQFLTGQPDLGGVMTLLDLTQCRGGRWVMEKGNGLGECDLVLGQIG